MLSKQKLSLTIVALIIIFKITWSFSFISYVSISLIPLENGNSILWKRDKWYKKIVEKCGETVIFGFRGHEMRACKWADLIIHGTTIGHQRNKKTLEFEI